MGLTSPFRWVYEAATMPMLSHMTGRLRETFFAHKFIEEHRRLTRNARERGSDVTPEQIERTAMERAMVYTDQVTFTRNPTIFEDVNRNIVPFINSYRQFAQYWIKTFVRYPVTMVTAYNEAPLKDQQFQQSTIGGWVYSTPVSWLLPFWMQSEFGTGARGGAQVIKQSIPAINPHLSAAAAWGASFFTSEDISSIRASSQPTPHRLPTSASATCSTPSTRPTPTSSSSRATPCTSSGTTSPSWTRRNWN